MKGGAHPSPFAALSFPNSKKVPIYCWVDREGFPVVAALNSHLTATFCSITEPVKPNKEKRVGVENTVLMDRD